MPYHIMPYHTTPYHTILYTQYITPHQLASHYPLHLNYQFSHVTAPQHTTSYIVLHHFAPHHTLHHTKPLTVYFCHSVMQENPLPQSIEVATGMFDATSKQFILTQNIVFGLFGFFVLLGLLWEAYRYFRSKNELQEQGKRDFMKNSFKLLPNPIKGVGQ